jgi:hypothetical protein
MRIAREAKAVYAVHAEHTLIERALGQLRALGLTVGEIKFAGRGAKAGVDARVRLGHGKVLHEYAIEAKKHLTPANLGATLQQLALVEGKKLVIAEYITPPLALRLRELGVAFADAQGNACITEPPLFIWAVGHKPVAKPTAMRTARLFQPGGLKIIFALLCVPGLVEAPLRKIADAAKVALGTAAWVIEDLRNQGYVRDLGKRGRTLVNRRKLMNLWVDVYPHQLKPKLAPRHLTAPRAGWWRQLDLRKAGALLGGEPAGALLTKHLKPETVTMYLQRGLAPLMTAATLLPPDDHPNVELIPVFWNFETDANHPETAPPLLVYADLLAIGDDRCIETAKLIDEKYLTELTREA